MNNTLKTALAFARELRNNATPSEKLLWQNLRKRKRNRVKFLRQHPILFDSFKPPHKTVFFIPDFYCAEAKLIVELDGEIHLQQTAYDNDRDEIISSLGLRVLRFKNEDLKNMQAVLDKIDAMLNPSLL